MRARLPALLAVLLLLLLLPCGTAAAQESAELDRLYDQAQEAIELKSYETAVRLLTEAKQKFPSVVRVIIALADLYYEKELYSLALEEYRQAEAKGALDITTLTQISRCYGKLNREKTSIEYLERIVELFPDSAASVDDLGWMYFKTHQLEKGERILLAGIAKFGLDMDMAMTLGTVYSGMYRYEKSKQYYLEAIQKAIEADDSVFAAIAYYNLSLLERNFYRYNSALRYTDESIAMEERSSGHLARGELLQSRMEVQAALREYDAAAAADKTPLSRVNLAMLYQEIGSLELARRYAEEALSSRDLAWMMYYGTDVTRHFKDIHELLADVHAGLARMAVARPTAGPVQRVAALLSALRHRIVSLYYRQRYRIASLEVGRSYLEQGSLEDAWLEFYRANGKYPEVAAKYLGLARELETARAPQAEAFYLQEEGILRAIRRAARALHRQLRPVLGEGGSGGIAGPDDPSPGPARPGRAQGRGGREAFRDQPRRPPPGGHRPAAFPLLRGGWLGGARKTPDPPILEQGPQSTEPGGPACPAFVAAGRWRGALLRDRRAHRPGRCRRGPSAGVPTGAPAGAAGKGARGRAALVVQAVLDGLYAVR